MVEEQAGVHVVVEVHQQPATLFVDFEHPNRMRITGQASLQEGSEDSDALVVVTVDQVWPNCPRYVHTMQLVEHSVYAPKDGHVPPVPEWKQMDLFKDVLPGTPA